MDWYPQQLCTAEQAAAVFLLDAPFPQKCVFWSTQAMFTAEQAAAGFFLRPVFLKKNQCLCTVCLYLTIFVNICQYLLIYGTGISWDGTHTNTRKSPNISQKNTTKASCTKPQHTIQK